MESVTDRPNATDSPNTARYRPKFPLAGIPPRTAATDAPAVELASNLQYFPERHHIRGESALEGLKTPLREYTLRDES